MNMHATQSLNAIIHAFNSTDLQLTKYNQIQIKLDWNWFKTNWPFICTNRQWKEMDFDFVLFPLHCIDGSLTFPMNCCNCASSNSTLCCIRLLLLILKHCRILYAIDNIRCVAGFHCFLFSPEHLKSCSCSSAKLCPFNWLGEWHRVYGARRGELRRYRDNHDKWQSHVNGLSDKRNARMRGIPLNISRGKVVILLLFNVLQKQKMAKNIVCFKRLRLQVND